MPKWKKGCPSPNPKGRPPEPKDVKEIKKLTRFEIERVLNHFLYLTPTQLKKVKENPESTALELLILSVMTHAINKGDHARLNFLLEQMVGRIKTSIEHSGEVSNPYMAMPYEELKKLVTEKLKDE